MAKVVKREKPLNKNSLRFIQAVLKEDTAGAEQALRAMVIKNLKDKFAKAEKETDLF